MSIKRNIKNSVNLIILLAIIIGLYHFISPRITKEYHIKITFCDAREPIEITVNALYEPSNFDIDNKEGTPIYCPNSLKREKFINVCDVSVINN